MEREIRTEPEAEILDLASLELHGLHYEEQEPADLSEDDDEHVDGSLQSLIDAFAEAYNAHDVDGVLELLDRDAELPGMGGDLTGFVPSVERLWDDRPMAVLTRETSLASRSPCSGTPVTTAGGAGSHC